MRCSSCRRVCFDEKGDWTESGCPRWEPKVGLLDDLIRREDILSYLSGRIDKLMVDMDVNAAEIAVLQSVRDGVWELEALSNDLSEM